MILFNWCFLSTHVGDRLSTDLVQTQPAEGSNSKRDRCGNRASLIFLGETHGKHLDQGETWNDWPSCTTWTTSELPQAPLCAWWEQQWGRLLEGTLMPELKVPTCRKELFSPLVPGDIQSCSQISQPAKASPKKSTAMFFLINWTIWVCERKQKNIWGKSMSHVTVCFSLNHPDWLTISRNPEAADTATPPCIKLLVSYANCFTSFDCLLLLYLHYFPFSLILSYASHLCCLQSGGDSGSEQRAQILELNGHG